MSRILDFYTLFPLPEPSRVHPGCPVVTQEDFDGLAGDPVLGMRMLAALGRYVAFLDRTTQWRQVQDHNHLRITRVMGYYRVFPANTRMLVTPDYLGR